MAGNWQHMLPWAPHNICRGHLVEEKQPKESILYCALYVLTLYDSPVPHLSLWRTWLMSFWQTCCLTLTLLLCVCLFLSAMSCHVTCMWHPIVTLQLFSCLVLTLVSGTTHHCRDHCSGSQKEKQLPPVLQPSSRPCSSVCPWRKWS